MHFGENPQEVLVEWELGFVCFVLFQSSSIVWFGEVSTVCFGTCIPSFLFGPFIALSLYWFSRERECVCPGCVVNTDYTVD